MSTNNNFWSEANLEPKRSFRWMLYISGMPQFIVKSAKKPSFSVAETPHEFLNYKFYYPGRVEWNTIDVTIVDPVQPDSTASLMKILHHAGYEPPSEFTAMQNSPRTISKEAFVETLGRQISLVQFGANTGSQTQNVIEHWVLNNPFLTSVDFGNLDYSSDDLVNISMTIRYDWANLRTPDPRGAAAQGKLWTTQETRSNLS